MKIAAPVLDPRTRPACAGLLFIIAILLAAPAAAINTQYCDDDGVTEIPPFALGRDGNQCLEVDPGNGDAPIKFQWEIFHKSGMALSATDSGDNTSGIDVIDLQQKSACRGKNDGCSFLVWGTVFDNYSSKIGKNEDVIFLAQGDRHQYTLIKDSVIANGWKCAGGGWTGPNGLKCNNGEDSSAHSDGMQLRGQPVLDGWIVFQDTIFVNGYNLHLLSQVGSTAGKTGSLVFQGGEVGRRQSIGAANTWISDCEARKANNDSSSSDICPDGRITIGGDNREIWLIDVYGETNFSPKGNHEKIVVVQQSGCGTNACGTGSIQYNNGWPHPLDYGGGDGNSTCPNGSIGNFRGTPAYCYRSLEAAASDHKLPPFVQLSATGWDDPQAVSAKPAAPTLLP